MSPRASSLTLAAALLALLATGCGLSGTNSSNYISGDGQVVQIPVAQRGTPVDLAGTSLEGKGVSLASTRGKVTVINTWWSGCAPCIQEAPLLEQTHRAVPGAAFVGINVRDLSAANGLSFERGLGVTFPSIYSPDGSAVLAFNNAVSPRDIPATIVLDPSGRVAAIIRGPISSVITLKDVIQDAAKSGTTS